MVELVEMAELVEMSNLRDMRADGDLDPDDFHTRMKKLLDEKALVEAELKKIVEKPQEIREDELDWDKIKETLNEAYQENRLETRLKFFSKYKVLIIDEIGYMPIDTDTANIFFQLIAKRYEKNSTIITTNMPFSKWGEFFESATLANAVLDRLLHHSEVISIKGPSYRIKDKRLVLEAQAAEK